MNTYLLKVLVHEKKIYSGNVISMTLTCEDGQLTVLAGHADMVAAFVEGTIVIKTESETIEGTTGSGILQVSQNEVTVMARSLEWSKPEAEEDTEKDGILADESDKA